MWIRTLMILAAVLAGSPRALADVDNEQADKLFLAARDLLEAGQVEQACKTFEASLRYNPQAISTRLHLAQCEERLGRIASAVAKYREVADRAVDQKLADFKTLADERIAALAPDVPHVVIVAHEPLPEMKVLIDDRAVPVEQLDRLAVDPGEHVLVVTAPGRVAYRTGFAVKLRDLARVEVPPLARRVASTRRTIGKLTVAAGGATLVAGIVLGLVANGRYDDTRRDPALCGPVTCTPDGHSRIESARTLGNVGTALGVIGLAAAAAGGYLWWRAPARPEQAEVSVVPHVGPASVGVVATGRF